MPPFPKPSFSYNYQVQSQVNALRHYRDTKPGRQIPAKANNRLLLATWNIANLGVQERRSNDYRLIAEIISWFDLIAVQEVHDNLAGLRGIAQHLPANFRLLFSDVAGNHERIAFIYDSSKITVLEMVGEVAIPPASQHYITLPGIGQKFRGFDRNPYVAAFQAGSFRFVLVSVHIYYGSESKIAMNRRRLETFAVGRWADLERKSPYAYTTDVIALGDFNLPKVDPGDPIYQALTKRGLQLPDHTSQIGSAIATDSYYDQIAFFPGQTSADFTGERGVFDFDGALFETLYHAHKSDFIPYLKYYISDHRPMWAQFRI